MWRSGFLSWLVEYVSSECYCQAVVHDSYMQIVEPLQSLRHDYRGADEWPAASSHEMMIIIDHDDNICIEGHNCQAHKHEALNRGSILTRSGMSCRLLHDIGIGYMCITLSDTFRYAQLRCSWSRTMVFFDDGHYAGSVPSLNSTFLKDGTEAG